MFTTENPYIIKEVVKITVGVASQVVDTKSYSVYIQNMGTGKVYMGPSYRDATANDALLDVGYESRLLTGSFSLVSDVADTDVRIVYLESVT